MRWTFAGVVCFVVLSGGCSSEDSNGNGGSGASGGASTGGSGGSSTGGSSGATTGGTGGTSTGGTGGTSAGGSAGTSTGGAGGTSCGFSDEFEAASLDPCWTTLNGTPSAPLIQIAATGGALHLQANDGQNGVWYAGSTKALVYKLVTGDFRVTTTAHPRKRTNVTEAPTIALHVGGIMARSPSSSGGQTENYVFTMVGSNEFAEPGVEIKSTTNGQSQWDEPEWSDPLVAELRLCRIGASFYAYKRAPGGGTWILSNHDGQAAAISRPDLPPTLQVGLALNFSGPNNDLDVSFDAITLDVPASVDDCTSD
jgi:hypothetical protein